MADSFSPTGATIQDLMTGGLRGLLNRVLATRPGLTAVQSDAIRRTAASPAWERATNAVDQYIGGSPTNLTGVLGPLSDLGLAADAISQVAAEAAALLAENPGTLESRPPFGDAAWPTTVRTF